MQLTRHTDYALRLLLHLAQHGQTEGAGLVSIAEVAAAQDISRTHLMKIANQLARAGFIRAARGRTGGLELGMPPEAINLGAVVALTEPRCNLVDCQGCKLLRRCGLPGIFDEAMAAFRGVLARYSLADFMNGRVATAA
ncbi:MAG: Rrf2 family transcriptional regulator [Sphingomonadales bacterium]|nr:Rrf2 family transcriptional regulator [Sphingomonadales bacterium]